MKNITVIVSWLKDKHDEQMKKYSDLYDED